MIALLLFIGIISIIVFLNNFISILKKIKNDEATSYNTMWCVISLILVWGISLFLCSI
ncbi:hypothetical protein GCM10008908_12500 [Clostridium subterminale]|uniref:Uncharacterized protein n=1 Tax=Clostridium subterminale TaxID=1550 RepID=A0ABP3VUR7_CLOSU